MTRLLATLLVLLIGLSTAFAHAYHASVMDLRLNAKTQQLEVALKIFTDDLETTLSKGQPKPVTLDQTAVVQPLMAAYLRRTVSFGTKPGETLPLNYVGMEREKDAHWVYFSVKLPRPVQTVTLRHHLLMDQFPDQMNIVNLEAGGKKQSALFRDGNEVQELKW
jgi:hypothetical protein